uniref:Pyruvate phosphate dikinase AMP/ATP-binding domain-containing protein n=1 Tax=Zooxanthella nutricula TaxID=1333877 RepID=A0A7S2Q7K2_9DINO
MIGRAGGHAVSVDVVSEPEDIGGWTALEVSAEGFGDDDLIMHWGVGKQHAGEWALPVETQAKTTPASTHVQGACQALFPASDAQGVRKVKVEIKGDCGVKGFQFVLHRKPNDWLKNGNSNFLVNLDKMQGTKAFRDLMNKATAAEPTAKQHVWSCSGVDVGVLASDAGGSCNIRALVNSEADLVLQYGPARADRRWLSSTRLELKKVQGTVSEGTVALSGEQCQQFLMFVLHDASTNQWLKDGGRDFAMELPSVDVSKAPSPKASEEFKPAPRLERTNSIRFSKFVKEAVDEDSEATVQEWRAGGMEIVALASASETECIVHVLADTKAEMTVQYGCAGADRAWKFSKRIPLANLPGSAHEAFVSIPASEVDKYLMFVLHEGAVNRWIKDGNNDFCLELPRHEEWDRVQREAEARKKAEAEKALEGRGPFLSKRKEREAKAAVSWSVFDLEGDCGDVDVACYSEGAKLKVELRAWLHPRLGKCTLHFGALQGSRSGDWKPPLEQKGVEWPAGVQAVDAKACQVQLQDMGGHVQGLDIAMTATTKKSDNGSDPVIEPAIAGISFVMKDETGNEWFKPRSGGNANARFSSIGRWKGEWAHVADKIVEQEVTWEQMSLKRRYENCLDFVDSWEKESEGMAMRKMRSWNTLMHVDNREAVWSRMPSMPLFEVPEEEDIKASKEGFWSWIFVWQRFSFQRLLTWERNTCTQPRMLAGTTNQITSRMAELWKAHLRCRMWIRWTLATMGRGGNAGQQIRDEILVIMHAHDIKEIHGTYYEQWHQKLHNNTTPEDIGICRAIIKYLQTDGNMSEYWKVLGDHGIDKERLASYSRPITTEPNLPNTDRNRLIKDFERYLGILRSVHDALDLQLAVDHAKWALPGDLQGKLQAICDMNGTKFSSLDEGHGKFMKIHEARQQILSILNSREVQPNQIKELLIIDYSCETQQSVLIQGMGAEARLVQLGDQLSCLLTSLVGHLPTEDELQAILADWNTLGGAAAQQKWNGPTESALLLKAMADRTSRVVGELCDKCQQLMGPKAAFLGEQIEAPKRNIDVFVDEVLRGTSLIAVSLVLQRLEPVLREIAHLPPWQMISPVDKPVQGEFQLIDKMMHIQDKVFETPTVLLSGAVSGEEEVPDGVVGVLVRSAKEAPDILSHCAVRARNFGVLLATCFDPKISEQLEHDFKGKWVEVRCKPNGTLEIEAKPRPTGDAAKATNVAEDQARADNTKVKMNLSDPLGCSWCIRPDQMDKVQVGSKSLNLALLQPKLPKDILTPQAVALPYGCMQKALIDATNKDSVLKELEKVLSKLQPKTSNEEAQFVFEQAQLLIQSMKMPESLKTDMLAAMVKVGAEQGEERLKELFVPRDAWDAIKGVWSSLFAIRPWVSLAKAGRSFHDLNMAVLVQELVEAKYAFVLHTVNPFTHDKDELYGEVVAGRGETLVGNFPGRALSFSVKRGGEPKVISFPSKSVALHTQHCLIFRSDSNGEDLEGFAGAGLFESVCAEEDKPGIQRIHRMPLVTDHAYRAKLLKRIAETGWAVEKAFDGMPQDIEGCVDVRERVFVVQSRPQV